MRLLLVTDAVGGVWVYSLELARALRPFGIETILAVIGPSPDTAQRHEASGFKLIDTGLPLDWLETSPRDLRRAGDELAAIARREDADIVQTCSPAHLAHTAFDQPVIAVQHSCLASWWAAVKGPALPYDFAWRRELVETGLHRASEVVAPTVGFAAETARIYDVHVSAVHNGRRPSAVSPLPQADFVLTASRLWDEGKNVLTLDAAAAQLDGPFGAAGPTSGPNGSNIRLENLYPLGKVSSARLAVFLAARPVFASAALYEPFGLTALEAAQAGCALVLSDIATHRELWGGAAIFIEPHDDAGFASAIQNLLDHPDKRRELGEFARERARIYTPERMAAGMAEIYARVVESRAERVPAQLAGAA